MYQKDENEDEINIDHLGEFKNKKMISTPALFEQVESGFALNSNMERLTKDSKEVSSDFTLKAAKFSSKYLGGS